MASKFILGSGACSIQRLSASPGEVCHRCANISRWQCASTTSTPGACHCAGLTGKWRIHSCCCGDNLWNKPSIVVQFSSADGQFGGWISMLVTVLFWYCSNHIRYASRVGDRVTPGAAGWRRSRRQKSSNSNSLEKPNRIAISWSSSFIVWIQLRKRSSVNLPTSRSTHHLWRSIRLQWFSVARLHCQQAISGVKYHGKCSISTCLFTECTSLPHMGHDRILVETEGAGPVAGGVCGDEFITAEAAVCVGKSTTWGTSSDAIAVEPINGGAIICACVGGFIPAEAAVCGGKSTTWGASSDAVAVEPFTGGATICACVGRFLGAPCSALKLIESTSLTGASFSAPDENTTASADSDAADDTVSGPIRTIRSTSRERTTLVLTRCCVRMVIVWRPPTSYGTGLRCCLRSPRLRVLSGWKCPLDWPELICGGPRASPRVSWCQRSSHHCDVRFSFASCWRWYGWARFLLSLLLRVARESMPALTWLQPYPRPLSPSCLCLLPTWLRQGDLRSVLSTEGTLSSLLPAWLRLKLPSWHLSLSLLWCPTEPPSGWLARTTRDSSLLPSRLRLDNRKSLSLLRLCPSWTSEPRWTDGACARERPCLGRSDDWSLRRDRDSLLTCSFATVICSGLSRWKREYRSSPLLSSICGKQKTLGYSPLIILSRMLAQWD